MRNFYYPLIEFGACAVATIAAHDLKLVSAVTVSRRRHGSNLFLMEWIPLRAHAA